MRPIGMFLAVLLLLSPAIPEAREGGACALAKSRKIIPPDDPSALDYEPKVEIQGATPSFRIVARCEVVNGHDLEGCHPISHTELLNTELEAAMRFVSQFKVRLPDTDDRGRHVCVDIVIRSRDRGMKISVK